jgi:hypothetical protein
MYVQLKCYFEMQAHALQKCEVSFGCHVIQVLFVTCAVLHKAHLSQVPEFCNRSQCHGHWKL